MPKFQFEFIKRSINIHNFQGRSTRVLSGSADTSVKLWDAELGKETGTWGHRAPVRSVDWAQGEKSYLSVTDQVLGYHAGLFVWDVNSPGRGNLKHSYFIIS